MKKLKKIDPNNILAYNKIETSLREGIKGEMKCVTQTPDQEDSPYLLVSGGTPSAQFIQFPCTRYYKDPPGNKKE